LPIDLAGQRHHALFDLDRDALGRDPDLPLQDVDRARGDLVVRAFRIGRQADLDFLGDRPHTLDAQGGPLGRRRTARDEAGQRDDAVIRSNADMSGIDAWLEFELVDNVLPEL